MIHDASASVYRCMCVRQCATAVAGLASSYYSSTSEAYHDAAVTPSQPEAVSATSS